MDIFGIGSGYGHLYLVYRDDGGSEYVLRGGAESSVPGFFGDIDMLAGVLLKNSPDARGGDSPEDRGARLLELGGRDAADVWALMIQHAQGIEAASLDYQLFDQNSNSAITSTLEVMGIDATANMPQTVLDLAGNENRLAFDYRLTGTERADLMSGYAGNDVFSGMGGADTLSGGVGSDILRGNAGADDISGGGGSDLLVGHSQNDVIRGGGGADTVRGGGGADVIAGNGGDDTLSGQGGADIIRGGAGADLMFGGAGADVFRYRRGDGADVIGDLSGGDVIALYTTGFTLSVSGGDTVLDFGGGDTLTVLDVTDIDPFLEILIA